MKLHVQNETSRLREVVLGLPYSNGGTPTLDQTFDSKSYESVKNGVYPTEASIIREMEAFEAVLSAVEDGTLPESRIDESVRRILALKLSLQES